MWTDEFIQIKLIIYAFLLAEKKNVGNSPKLNENLGKRNISKGI